MDRNACNMVLRRSPDYMVILVHLFKQNEKMNALYDQDVITKQELLGNTHEKDGILSLFRPFEMTRLRNDLKRAQDFVKSHDIPTSTEFFQTMFLLIRIEELKVYTNKVKSYRIDKTSRPEEEVELLLSTTMLQMNTLLELIKIILIQPIAAKEFFNQVYNCLKTTVPTS